MISFDDGVFDLEWPPFQSDEVLRLIGCRGATGGELAAAAEEAIDWCRRVSIKPSAVGACFALKALPDGTMSFEGHSNMRLQVPYPFLEGAGHLYAGVVTLGLEPEAESSRRFAAGDPALGFILDALASEGLKRIVDRFHLRLRDRIRREGSIAGPRLFPGCHGIPLGIQQVVFGILPTGTIGVRLNESLVMIPKKSVSFIVPYGDGIPARMASLDTCDVCESRERCRLGRDAGSCQE